MNIIFHHPLPLDENPNSASRIRPLRILEAFKKLGCRVDLVTGFSAERKKKINTIKKNIQNGIKYDLLYSESSTMPTILTDPHHLPLHPFMDWLFFKFCNNNGIPIGLFYRDIYWLFETYSDGLNTLKRVVAKTAYWFDLWVYQQTLSKLYLPSLEMGRYIPSLVGNVFSSCLPDTIVMLIAQQTSIINPEIPSGYFMWVGCPAIINSIHYSRLCVRSRE